MVTLTLYIHDDRLRVPALEILNAANAGAARRIAGMRLLESPHHTAVDVYEGDTFRFSLEAPQLELTQQTSRRHA